MRKNKKKTSIHVGVSWYPQTKQWRGMCGGGPYRDVLGYFNTEEEAALAYNKAAIKRFGQRAKLNIIPEKPPTKEHA